MTAADDARARLIVGFIDSATVARGRKKKLARTRRFAKSVHRHHVKSRNRRRRERVQVQRAQQREQARSHLAALRAQQAADRAAQQAAHREAQQAAQARLRAQQAADRAAQQAAHRDAQAQYGNATTLYRHYDRDGRLLYVGITYDPGRRLSQHRGAQWWWSQVASTTMQHFPSRAQAADAERVAIATERPFYNIVGNPHR